MERTAFLDPFLYLVDPSLLAEAMELLQLFDAGSGLSIHRLTSVSHQSVPILGELPWSNEMVKRRSVDARDLRYG